MSPVATRRSPSKKTSAGQPRERTFPLSNILVIVFLALAMPFLLIGLQKMKGDHPTATLEQLFSFVKRLALDKFAPTPKTKDVSAAASEEPSPNAIVASEIRAAVSNAKVKVDVPSKEDKVTNAGKIVLHAAGYCIKKTTSSSSHECGEDAFSIALSPAAPSKGRSYLAVADGVGGWTESGGDSSRVSVGLLEEIKQLIANNAKLGLSEAAEQAFERMSALQIHKLGSTTFCTALFDHEVARLDISNVGDSGAMIIRRGRIIFKSKIGVEGFNAPHQVGFDHGGRPYGSIRQYETRHSADIQPGDVIVLVTDGVLDNLFEQEIVDMTLAMLGPIVDGSANEKVIHPSRSQAALQERIQSAATTLAWHSWARSKEAHWRSPFAESALRHGYFFTGGKQDDITVVIAVALY